MLMMCWFYCVPFAKLFYFALSGVLLVFALFSLKRGVYGNRVGLRQWAFVMMYFAVAKSFLFDAYIGRKEILCDFIAEKSFISRSFPCSDSGMRNLMVAGVLLFIGFTTIIYILQKEYMPERKIKSLTPDQVNLRFWANTSLWAVLSMILWLSAPWVGYLTIGRIPEFFLAVSWQTFAMVNLFLLLLGFWKSESCVWRYAKDDKDNKEQTAHLRRMTWTPRDTLWLNTFLYLIALALSYISNDVLTLHNTMQVTAQ